MKNKLREREREREREVTFLCETTMHRMEEIVTNLQQEGVNKKDKNKGR